MYTIVSLYDSNIVLLSRKANVFMVSSMQTDSVSIDFIDENVFTFINEESCLSVVWECTQMVLSSLQGLLSPKVQWKLMVVYMGIVGDSPRNRNNHKLSGDDYHQYDWNKWTLMDKMVLCYHRNAPVNFKLIISSPELQKGEDFSSVCILFIVCVC